MHRLPVFYTSRMVADAGGFSPSARKPAEVVESWAKLALSLDYEEPTAATFEQLCLAHAPAYVRGVLSGESENGFRNRSPAVAASLPYTSGAMLAAGRAAIENGEVAVAPCSGFHHARWTSGGGFCTFNGLMVTAAVLRAEGLVQNIGILDFDQHWGDGTQEIIEQISAQDWVRHYSPMHDYGTVELAERFIVAIPTIAAKFVGCDLVLYQAGADPHIRDPLGGWLDDDQLYRRDLAVFQSLSRLGIPVAWNLAGGYQRPLRLVLNVHDQTMRACHAAYARPISAKSKDGG